MSDGQEHKYTFNVDMTCGGCSGAVNRVLGKLEGVKSFDASHETKLANVTVEPNGPDYAKVYQTIAKAKKVNWGEIDGVRQEPPTSI